MTTQHQMIKNARNMLSRDIQLDLIAEAKLALTALKRLLKSDFERIHIKYNNSIYLTSTQAQLGK